VAQDSVWRCVIGVGAFPALIAIALRFTIPETPRYLLDVREDLPAAAQATRRVHPDKANTPSRQNSNKITKGGSEPYLTSNDKEAGVVQSSSIDMENKGLTQRQSVRSAEIKDQSGRGRSDDIVNGSFEIHQAPSGTQKATSDETRLKSNGHAPDPGSKISGKDLATQRRRKNEFWYDWHATFGKGQGFRRILAGISICWFIMDMSFYGLGLDTPRTLAKIFGAQPSDATKNGFDWNSGLASQDENIYDALLGDATRALYTIPISGIFGSVVFLLLVNYIPRATVLRWMFVLLAILFAVAGSSLTAVYETTNHSLTVAFYALALCILNFGPNTILFMLPAELFPTRYRGTCYGIAAASGKA
jgi:PHS family inorganic phosphate transporter-like MFS transporter